MRMHVKLAVQRVYDLTPMGASGSWDRGTKTGLTRVTVSKMMPLDGSMACAAAAAVSRVWPRPRMCGHNLLAAPSEAAAGSEGVPSNLPAGLHARGIRLRRPRQEGARR